MRFKEAVSQRILELCKAYNYTPNKLAELSATPQTTLLSLLANRVENPSSLVIYRICKVLNMEVKDFYDSELFKFENIDD